MSSKDTLVESNLQPIQAFPGASPTATNTSKFVHGGSFNASGLALGINDGIAQSSSVMLSSSLSGGQS